MVGTVHGPPLDAVRQLRDTHALARSDPPDPDRARPTSRLGHGARNHPPADAISAQFSLAFGVGLQFVTAGNAPADYFDQRSVGTTPRSSRSAISVERTQCRSTGDPAFSARVDIELDERTKRFSHYQAGFRGHPTRPATTADIETSSVPTSAAADTAQAILKTVRNSTVWTASPHWSRCWR